MDKLVLLHCVMTAASAGSASVVSFLPFSAFRLGVGTDDFVRLACGLWLLPAGAAVIWAMKLWPTLLGKRSESQVPVQMKTSAWQLWFCAAFAVVCMATLWPTLYAWILPELEALERGIVQGAGLTVATVVALGPFYLLVRLICRKITAGINMFFVVVVFSCASAYAAISIEDPFLAGVPLCLLYIGLTIAPDFVTSFLSRNRIVVASMAIISDGLPIGWMEFLALTTEDIQDFWLSLVCAPCFALLCVFWAHRRR